MITQLTIENYKSIQELSLDVGRVNVLIGENGCGKSNILEAITFAAAAEANKLDNEFLFNRGIRVTEPKLMRSVFVDNVRYDYNISITFKFSSAPIIQPFILVNDNAPYSNWTCLDVYTEELEKIIELTEKRIFDAVLNNIEKETIVNQKDKRNITNKIKDSLPDLIKDLISKPISKERLSIKDFVIYSPENSTLRNFEKEAQIQPLGIYGEGLFKLLTVIQSEAKESEQAREELKDIQESLELFGWYEAINIPDDYRQLNKSITIKDRYLDFPFDQRSANEGFLLVLFYITLVVSKYTPKIFAIDNIDTSLNPKLCTKLIKELSRLAKKYDKQLFVTSHNPAILDGIDLGDDEQRLFVVSRNDNGHTCCDRITLKDKPKSSTRAKISRVFKNNEDGELFSKQDILNKFDDSEEPLKLSEALLRGYLGGLPEGF